MNNRFILNRVIPCLLLHGYGLVKTIRFKDPVYVGDPRNAVKIFNEKEVDELVLLDILATKNKTIQYSLIEEIVSEAFMPLAYGGGIRSVEEAKRILSIGIEKVVLNSEAVKNPDLISEISSEIGSLSLVICMDVKVKKNGGFEIFTDSGRKKSKKDPVEFAREAEKLGAGELMINSIDRDGTQSGYDLNLIKQITGSVSIPVIACGGAGSLENLHSAIHQAHASAVAAGSLFVFQGRHRAVLINYPSREELKRLMNA